MYQATLLANIPEVLRQRAQWVTWRYETDPKRPEKPKKVPYSPRDGKRAKTNNPATWGDFDTAVRAARDRGHDGIGYVFTASDPYVGVDLDTCRSPDGTFAPWAADVLAVLPTYSEISPSQTGVKLIAEGDIPKALCKRLHEYAVVGQDVPAIEIYKTGRFFAITGEKLPDSPADIVAVNGALTAVYARFAAIPRASSKTVATPKIVAPPRPTSVHQHAEQWAEEKLQWACDELAGTPDGGRHNRRLEMARLVGGVVALGLLDEARAAQRLYDALPPSAHQAQERKAIADGIQMGMRSPLAPPTFPTDQALVVRNDGAFCPACATPVRRSAYDYPGTITPGWYCPSCKHPMVWPPDAYAPPDACAYPVGAPAQHLPSRDEILGYLGEGEAGDAQLLAALYRRQLVYDHRERRWYTFAGHAWKPITGAPRQLVWGRLAGVYLGLAGAVQGEGETAGEDEKSALLALVEALTERAKKLRSLGRINNVLALASDAGLLGIDGDMWDRDPWLLGVANGVLDLRSGQLRDGQPEDFIRLVAPTPWQGLDTPCPRFERFVGEVMSDEPERADFLQRLLGYSINGTTREHILALLVGHRGRNGKRVLMETVQHALGDYASTVSTDVLIGQERWRSAGSAQPHLMDLVGKRLAICSETGEHDQLAAATVKNITGGDEIRARRLHENLLSFRPSHTLFLQTNRKPQAPADDDALWERVKVIEFKVRFVDEPGAPDERPRDHTLEAALRDEAPGILAWLVRGHLDWLRDGLRTPESVKLARDSYRKGESIEPFLAACCEEWDGGQAEAGALYAAYEQWCDAEQLKPKTQHWFGRQVAARFEKGRTSGGRTCYFGLSVVTAPERATQGGDVRKGSEVVGTLSTGSGASHSAPSTEPFPPCSRSFDASSTHEANPMEQGSKGSEGSAPDDTPQPDIPSVTVMRQRNGTYLVTDWRPGAPRNGLLVFAEEAAAQAYVAAANGHARETT